MRPDGVIRQRFRGRGKRISGHGFYTGHGSYTGHTPHLTICSPLRSTRHAGDRERSKGGFNRELGVLPVISAHVRAPASTSRHAPPGEFTFHEKPRCITAKFEKSHPALWGHYYSMKVKPAISSEEPGAWVATSTD